MPVTHHSRAGGTGGIEIIQQPIPTEGFSICCRVLGVLDHAVEYAGEPLRIDLINLLGESLQAINMPGLHNEIEISGFSEKVILVKVSFRDGFALQRVIVR